MRIRPPNVRSYPYDWLWLMRFCKCNESNGEIEIDKWKKRNRCICIGPVLLLFDRIRMNFGLFQYIATHSTTPNTHSICIARWNGRKKKRKKRAFNSVQYISYRTHTYRRTSAPNRQTAAKRGRAEWVYPCMIPFSVYVLGTMSKGS